jgi:SAM-dependent methyltransferase
MLKKIAARIHTREILKRVGIDKNNRVVEIGCNRGYLITELRHFSDHVCGVDIDKHVVCQAQKRNHDVFVCDAENLAFPDCFFDIVISVHVVEHLIDIAKAIREFARILKPDGSMILVYPFEPVAGITCIPFAPLSNTCRIHVRVLKPKDLLNIVQDNRIDLSPVSHGGYYNPNPTYISVFKRAK